MKQFRKFIFWLHLIAGVTAGVIIFVMSVTGVSLAFEKQITTWADGYQITPPSPGVSHLPLETLLEKIHATQPETPSAITLRSDSTAPVGISFGRDKTIFANPYTGEILGEGAKKTRAFFHLMTDWHRWLGTDEQGRSIGRGITGACNLAFLFLVVSGIYIWWPRNWSVNSLKAVALFQRGLRGKSRDFNWHNVIGIWSAIPLFFIVLAAVFMSYTWANNLLYRATGNEPPPPQQRGGGQNSARGETRKREGDSPRHRENAEPKFAGLNAAWKIAEPKFAGLNAAWKIAEQKIPGWKTISLRFPPSPNAPLSFSIDTGNVGRPDLRTQLTIDAKSGEVLRTETLADANLARKIRSWGRFIHTGEAGGLPGQFIAGLASAGAAVLVYTGISLACRRFLGRKNKRGVQNKILATISSANALSE